MLAALQSLYMGDEYVLVDGDKITPPIRPSRGVKQGCPLSPFLFSLYLNDVDKWVGDGATMGRAGSPLGAVAGTGDLRVSHMLYADDLCLTANTCQHLEALLRQLRRYADAKGLTVNVAKSLVVVFLSLCPSDNPLWREGSPGLQARV